MCAVEAESTGAEEMSLFQRLSEGNGRKPLRLAPWPTDICEQLEVCTDPLTWRFCAEELLAPGPGFCTVTENVPGEMPLPVAVSCVEETKCVVSGVEFMYTMAPFRNLLPVSVTEKLPRLVEEGEMPVRTGVGVRMVMVLEEDLEVSITLVAVSVTVLGLGTVEGEV